jgi:hypothetical protein
MYDKTPLCLLFEKYGSDKCLEYLHTYSPHYYEMLNPIKSDVRLVVEVGVGNIALMTSIVPKEKYLSGASLRAWRDFFKEAIIYGLDINSADFFTCERIECLYADQSSKESLSLALELITTQQQDKTGVDLIIDDGSHLVPHMLLTYDVLKHSLKPGGIYIIEDILKKDMNIFNNLESPGFKLIKSYEGVGSRAPQQDCFVAYQRIL